MNPTQWFSVQWVRTDRQRISELEMENSALHLNEVFLGAKLAEMRHTARENLELAQQATSALRQANNGADESHALARRTLVLSNRWRVSFSILLLYAVLATIVAALGWMR